VRLYAVACVVMFLLPIGGCATQSVLNMKIGQRTGYEVFLAPEDVTQSPDQSIVIRMLYKDTSKTRLFLLETTIAPSNMLSFIESSQRQAADNIPIVDVVSCIAMGQNRWLDELPSNAAARFAACRWGSYDPGGAETWYASNSFSTVHSLQIGKKPLIVAFRGRMKGYEEWAWWSTPGQDILLVPATCWDVLTAIFQIPVCIGNDIVHSAISLGDPGNDNPWRHLNRPVRYTWPRILDPQRHRILMTQEDYDDMQYAEAEFTARLVERNLPGKDRQIFVKSGIASYKRYLAQMPNGRHVPDALRQIALLKDAVDNMQYDKVRYSLSDLRQYIETHPSSKNVELAKATEATMLRNIAVEVRTPRTNDYHVLYTERESKTFVVGTTTRAAVESFIGPGISVASSNSLGSATYVWQVPHQRGEYIPTYPALPALPLVLLFDANDVLLEITGD
jgi:hypothetical protein